jgi:DNA invertase Pin-like site-specific DNA recombinase
MPNWWECQDKADQTPKFAYRAVACYRHSAQDRQENSISIQQDQVRPWAENNGVEIIHEFVDPGRSGLTAEGRPGFQDMMENWVRKRDDFQYILCLDVSRWGRLWCNMPETSPSFPRRREARWRDTNRRTVPEYPSKDQTENDLSCHSLSIVSPQTDATDDHGQFVLVYFDVLVCYGRGP